MGVNAMIDGWVSSVVIGIIMIAAGVAVPSAETGNALMNNVAAIFLIGGIIVVGITIYSKIK